jgi:hypothetical protein
MLGPGTGARSQISVRVRLYLRNAWLTTILGASLLMQLKKAIFMYKKHRDAFEKFSITFPLDVTAQWDKMVDDWDTDKSKPNPYEEPIAGTYTSPSQPTQFTQVNIRNNSDGCEARISEGGGGRGWTWHYTFS